MENQSALSSHSIRKVIKRSAAYPSFTLMQSFEFTRIIHAQLGNSGFHSRDVIAETLQMSPASIQGHLSTASQYSFLEMKSGEGYRSSEVFQKMYKPLSTKEWEDAAMEALRSPKLYEGLLKELRGQIVPNAIGLSTVLVRKYNIAENASQKAAEIFIMNLKELTLLGDENRLTFPEDKVPSIEVVALPDTASSEIQESPGSGKAKKSSKTEDFSIEIPLSNNRLALLIMPLDVNNRDLRRVQRFVDALKQDEESETSSISLNTKSTD